MTIVIGEEDAIISDELNHASIIDGIRLTKAKRYRYKHMDIQNLEEILKETQGRFSFIKVDSFSFLSTSGFDFLKISCFVLYYISVHHFFYSIEFLLRLSPSYNCN